MGIKGFWKEGKQNGYGLISGNNGNNYGFWSDGKLKNKVEDDETIKFIDKKIEETKLQKEYIDFQLKIQKYEKLITDGVSSQDTNSNSKNSKNGKKSKWVLILSHNWFFLSNPKFVLDIINIDIIYLFFYS